MLNLILVEDNPADRALIQLLVKQNGTDCIFTIFNNGEEAIKYFSEIVPNSNQIPNGVLLDLNVPKINGFEILNWLKENNILYEIPVAVLSSSTNYEDKMRVESKKAAFFSKSFNLTEMRKTMQDIIIHFQ